MRERALGTLTVAERQKISRFIAVQSFRTKAFLHGLNNAGEAGLWEVFERLWQSSEIVSSDIESRRWMLMSIEGNDQFYLGDNPVVLQHTENPDKKMSIGFDVLGVEAYLPISPKMALYLPCQSTSDEIVSSLEFAAIHNARITREIETGTLPLGFHMAKREKIWQILERRKPHYEALTKGEPYKCESESVVNLNYLQVRFAYDSVFSSRKDFSFAKHMLTRTPQYRENVETSFVSAGER